METNNQLIKSENEIIIIKKREQWANVGEVIHNKEQFLISTANEISLKLTECKSIEEIQTVEDNLKLAKQEINKLVTERKSITDNLNTVIGRLMNPEKGLLEKIPVVEKSIIDLKKLKASQELLVTQKNEEIKRLNSTCNEHLILLEASFAQKIATQISFAYEYALGKGDIKEATFKEYFDAVKAKFKIEDFALTMPVVNLIHLTKLEFELIYHSSIVVSKTANYWLDFYAKELEAKFEFFNIALTNKVAALEQSKKQEAINAEALALEAKNKTIAASLTSMATNIATPIESTTKPLKTVFDLDMEENEQNGLLIIAAFVGNFELTKQYVKVANFFSLSIGQMAKSLISVKNKDSKFECTGIIFKQIDKLK